MKTLPLLIFIGLFNLAATRSATAQAATGPKILLAPPAGQAVWTIRYTYQKAVTELVSEKKEDLAAKSLELSDLTRPEKVRYIIKNPVSSRIVDIEGGAKEEAYYLGNFEFRISPREKEVLTTNLASYPSADQLFRKRFPGVDWVQPKLFVKVEEAHGEPCAYFLDGNPAKHDPNSDKMDEIIDSSKYEIREAWFSVRTGLPVAFKAGGTLGKYDFEPAQNAQVQIPASIRTKMNEHAAYEAYQQKRAALGAASQTR
jgi:hypothetical protein